MHLADAFIQSDLHCIQGSYTSNIFNLINEPLWTNDHFIIDSSASNKKVILKLKLVKYSF